MEQHNLSLKLFKKQQSKTKKNTLLLKRNRKYKKEEKLGWDKKYLIISGKTPSTPLRFVKGKKGQILIESLFVIICLLAFLLAIHFFQSLGRKEIQKQRLKKQVIYKIKKASWYR